MRESRMHGSVRGALSNERPYRDRQPKAGAIQPVEALRSRPLAPAHRWRAQNLAGGAQYALGSASDSHQPLVIAAFGNDLQADRHAKPIEPYRQSRRAQ